MNADKSTSRAQDDALDRQAGVAEVQQQAEVQARVAKVVDALGAMDVGHCLGGVQFHDHRCFDQQVDRVVTNDDPIVADDDAALLRDREAGPRLRRGRLLRSSCASAFSQTF